VLANEQVLPNGCCYRHEHQPVEIRELEQWFVRTTDYAERLLRGLDELEGWPEEVKIQQRNWIGRSEGCRVRFDLDGGLEPLEVFTTRVDTIFGCSFLAVAADHPRALELARGAGREAEVRAFVESERRRGPAAPGEEVEKRGVFTGREALNPYNGERVPVWLANFVLMDFGTGAVFGQPAHDQRDFEFARAHGLPVRPVIQPPGEEALQGESMSEAYVGEGLLRSSGAFDGLDIEAAQRAMAEEAERGGFGGASVSYRLRDWGISRQRYWGTPIPMVYCEACGIVPVPDEELPVLLPLDVNIREGTGSPLARHPGFAETSCPACGGEARRETDTMDTFVDSSWYFFRYLDPRNEERPFEREAADYWFPIDFYVGGIEHAVGHLIYCRFWTMAMHDMGLCAVEEPVRHLLCQGMVNARSYRCENHDYLMASEVEEGAEGEPPRCGRCGEPVVVRVEKMSKSKFNVVDPDELMGRYGADAMRLFSLFAGPPVKGMEWTDEGIEGQARFLQRVLRLYERFATLEGAPVPDSRGEALALRRKTHETIGRVAADLEERLQPNTAIAAVMELVNQAYHFFEREPESLDEAERGALVECLTVLAPLLAPFAPHLAEEVWSRLGKEALLARSAWPEADAALLRREEVTLGVQVNGKRRGEIRVALESGKEEALAAAGAEASVARHLEGKEILKVILVPGKILNLVVR
jgi:leucyl-tRNA synthetase